MGIFCRPRRGEAGNGSGRAQEGLFKEGEDSSVPPLLHFTVMQSD